MNLAVKHLEKELIKAKDTSYNGIDLIMRRIMKKYGLTAKQLHNAFREKHKKTPDEWTKKMLNESKKQKLYREFSKAYDLGRKQSTSTFAQYPVSIEGQNKVITASDRVNNPDRKKAAIKQLIKKNKKTFEDFMFIANNYNVL